MFQRFAVYCQQHGLIRPGDRVLVAVSGGVDSVCLLHLLQRLTPTLSLEVQVAHLDHGMRPESRDDADFVEALCRRWGVPFRRERQELAERESWRGRGPEAALRDARRAFLHAMADRIGASRIALGHHRGDQAETLLLRLVRGTGVSGLAGMAPSSGRLIRPLLGFSRSEILAYAREQGLEWREDASNRSAVYDRNFLRSKILPRLTRLNAGVERALAGLGGQVALEESYWSELLQRLAAEAVTTDPRGVRLDRRRLLAEHPAVRLRLLRYVLEGLYGTVQGVQRRHLLALEALLVAERPQGEVHLPGLWAGRRYDSLCLYRQAPEVVPYTFPLLPGEPVQLPGGGRLRAEWRAPAGVDGAAGIELAATVPLPLLVRTRRPGDRIRLPGIDGRVRLKTLFSGLRLSCEQRCSQPIVLAGGEIVWLPGLRRSTAARAEAGCRQVLRLTWEPGGNGENP